MLRPGVAPLGGLPGTLAGASPRPWTAAAGAAEGAGAGGAASLSAWVADACTSRSWKCACSALGERVPREAQLDVRRCARRRGLATASSAARARHPYTPPAVRRWSSWLPPCAGAGRTPSWEAVVAAALGVRAAARTHAAARATAHSQGATHTHTHGWAWPGACGLCELRLESSCTVSPPRQRRQGRLGPRG